MATTSNFDSSGLSNGNDMFELMQNTESGMLQNRTKLLSKLENVNLSEIENINTYLLGIRNDLTRFSDTLLKENTKLTRKVNKQANIVIDNDLNNSFKVGVKNGIKEAGDDVISVEDETEQFKALKEITKTATQNSQLTAVTTQQRDFSIMGGLLIGAIFTSFQLGQDKSLYDIVDETQRKFTAKGVTGKVTTDNKQTSLASYNTGSIREQSQKGLLEGGGAVETPHDRVYVSEHTSASDACRPHQGKYYIDDVFRQGRVGRYNKLPLLSSAIWINRVQNGLFHPNCRHTVTYAPSGFDRPDAPDDAKTNKSGSVNSKKSKDTYKVEQKQRELQRRVRQYKQVEANALTNKERVRAGQLVKNNQSKLTQLEKFADRNSIAFYRQRHKENINFKFETFKPEF